MISRRRTVLFPGVALLALCGCRGEVPRPAAADTAAAVMRAAPDTIQAGPNDTVTVTDADSLPEILFISGSGYLQPVFIRRSADSLEPPPVGEMGDTAVERFASTWYRHRRYRVLVNGRPAGHIVALRLNEPGCTGNSAAARYEGEMPGRGLASNSSRFAVPGFSVRQVELDELRAFRHAAVDALPDSITPAQRERMGADELVAVQPVSGPAVLIGTWGTDSLALPDGNRGIAWLFVIAEKDGARYRATFHEFHAGGEADIVIPVLEDVLDFNQDSIADLLITNRYYESSEFRVLRRDGRTWRQVYMGGGGGC